MFWCINVLIDRLMHWVMTDWCIGVLLPRAQRFLLTFAVYMVFVAMLISPRTFSLCPPPPPTTTNTTTNYKARVPRRAGDTHHWQHCEGGGPRAIAGRCYHEVSRGGGREVAMSVCLFNAWRLALGSLGMYSQKKKKKARNDSKFQIKFVETYISRVPCGKYAMPGTQETRYMLLIQVPMMRKPQNTTKTRKSPVWKEHENPNMLWLDLIIFSAVI